MPFKPVFAVLIFFISGKTLFAQQPVLMLPIGHTDRLGKGSFSPDGKMVVTASDDKTVKIWEVESGFLLLNITGNTDNVTDACFSPDGNTILTSSEDHTAKIWDAKTGALIKNFIGHTDKVNSACISPDGKKILTASADKTAKIWEVSSGTKIKTLLHPHWVYSACFSPDGESIATASEDRKAYLWDEKNGMLHKILKEDTATLYGAGITSICFSPPSANDPTGGRKIITASFDKTVKMWDAISGKILLKFVGHSAAVNSVFFSPDGKKIVTASDDKTAIVWNAETGKVLKILKAHSDNVVSACFSPDGKKILTTSYDRTAKIWDAENGNLLKDLKSHTTGVFGIDFYPGKIKIASILSNKITNILDREAALLYQNLEDQSFITTGSCFSPDKKKIATIAPDFSVNVRDVEKGIILYQLKGHVSDVTSVSFSPDGKNILTGSFDGTAKIWDTKTGQLMRELKGTNEDMYIDKRISKARFSADGKKIVTGYYEGIARVWDVQSGGMLKEFKGHKDFIMDACFSPDGEKLATASTDNKAKIWDTKTGALLKTLDKHSGYVVSICFSTDGKKILTGSSDNSAKIWDAETGTLLYDLTGHSAAVFAFFSIANADDPKGSKWIFTRSEDNTIKKWDTNTGNCLYTFFAYDSSNYMLQIPSGYYQCTPGAAKLLHYVTNDLKAIGFEQLDIKYNRPDKILEAIGNTDTAIIATYRNAYYKRIKKLGIDTTAFRDGYSLPEANIVNRDSIAREASNEMLALHIKGIDSSYYLNRFNVWVNEVPVYGQRGISISNKRSGYIDSTVTIKLSQGENKIETSVINANGTESYRIPLTVNYTPGKKQDEKVYFIGIGINKFADADYNLHYSTKDIRDLCVMMKAKFKNNVIIDTLFNQDVTIANIKSLKKKLLQTTVNDKVIISYSGHGLLSKTYDYYLSTYSVKFSDPQENGLPYEELENLLDSIPARKKLMLIDACHSGEIDKEEYRQTKANKASLASNHVVYRGVILTNTDSSTAKIGLGNSFELMQHIFVNVGKSTGATIISAAAGTAFALETSKLKNGVFTYSILEAMNKYAVIKISELRKIIAARVEELTKGMQKPTSRNEAVSADWEL